MKYLNAELPYEFVQRSEWLHTHTERYGNIHYSSKFQAVLTTVDAQVFFQVVFVLEGFATFSAFKLSIPSSTWLSNMPLKNVRENALYSDEQYSCHLSVSVQSQENHA